MTVRPRVLGTRALLKPLDANESTHGGVVLPEEVREKETRGVVVDVGAPRPGELEPPVEIGDVVVYAENGATPYTQPTAVAVDSDESGVAERYVVVDYADLLLLLEDVP